MGCPTGYLRPRLAPTEHPTTKDICWAAGIFEGEGSVSPPSKYSGCLTAKVTQKDRWLLERLKALFGGSVYAAGKGCSIWQISGARGRGFVMTIFSLLSPRRQEQVKLALEGDLAYGK